MTESSNNAQSMAERLSALMDNSAEQSFQGHETQEHESSNGYPVDHECLERICAEDELKGQWARYHLIRDVIQDDYKAPLSPNFANNLSQLIAAEPALDCSALVSSQGVSESGSSSNVVSLADRKLAQESGQRQGGDEERGGAAESSTNGKAVAPASSGWRRATTGFAIAASVAMVSLVGLNTMQNSEAPGSTQTAENEPAQGTESSSVILAEQPVIVVPAGESQLEFVANTGTFWVNGDAASGSGMSKAGEQRLNMFLSEHIEHSPTSDVRGMIPYSRLAGYDAVRPAAPKNTEIGTEQQ